jgi:hypothetical protein
MKLLTPNSMREGIIEIASAVEPQAQNILFVDGWKTNSGDGSSWENAFNTMAEAFEHVQSGDIIYARGRFQEQITAPQDVFDVSIIGTLNRPRHGTADGVQQGFPAQWSPAATGTATPNLTLREQGWTIKNFLFDAPDAAACIKLSRTELAAAMDASHASFINCRFVGGGTGIEDSGGHFNVLVKDCVFQQLTNGIKCVGTGIDVPTQWQILNNEFVGNTNDIISSYHFSTIKGNIFHNALPVVNTAYNSGQGSYNAVVENFFGDTVSNYKGTVAGSATDTWVNYGTDALGFGHS